jgi:hypothetical protein
MGQACSLITSCFPHPYRRFLVCYRQKHSRNFTQSLQKLVNSSTKLIVTQQVATRNGLLPGRKLPLQSADGGIFAAPLSS